MNNDDIHGLSGAYAVDAVDDVERARFEAHLADCAECQVEVASLRAAAGELAAITMSAPAPALRDSVLRGIGSVRPLPPRVTPEQATDEPALDPPSSLESKREERARRTSRLGQWLVGVAAAVVLATGGVVWHPWSPSGDTAQLSATEQVLQAKDAQRFEKKIGEATATIVRSPSLGKAVITTANMPAPPQGKVYELWLQQGPVMVKAGLMPAGKANTVLLEGDAASAQGVGVTIEPAGGSETPTSAPVALIQFA